MAQKIRRTPAGVNRQNKAQRRRKIEALRLLAPPDRMTGKQLYYAQLRLDGMDPHDAALAAGYSENSHNWTDFDNNPNIKKYVRDLAAMEGITPQVILRKLREGMNATGVKDFVTKQGDVVSGPERIDFNARLEYLRLAGTWLGMDVSKTTEADKTGDVNILILSDRYAGMSDAAIRENMQKIKIGRITPENAGQEIVLRHEDDDLEEIEL